MIYSHLSCPSFVLFCPPELVRKVLCTLAATLFGSKEDKEEQAESQEKTQDETDEKEEETIPDQLFDHQKMGRQ